MPDWGVEAECEEKYWSNADVECERRLSSPEPSPAQQNLSTVSAQAWLHASQKFSQAHCSIKLFMLARLRSLLSLLMLLGLHLASGASGGERGESEGVVSVAELDPSNRGGEPPLLIIMMSGREPGNTAGDVRARTQVGRVGEWVRGCDAGAGAATADELFRGSAISTGSGEGP